MHAELHEASADLINRDRLIAWASRHLGRPLDTLKIRRMTGGLSNEMYALQCGDEAWVLRRPPRAATAPGAHNVAREFRMLKALDRTAVPHPQPIALCEDPGVIGAPFLLMTRVDGFAPRDPLPEPFASEDAARRRLALSLVDTLAVIGTADWRRAGLDGLGRPEGFLNRQVGRWLGQYRKYETRDVPYLDEVAQWLRAHQPATSPIGIVHGDFQFVNVLCDRTDTGRIAAVVDWELSTIGDPLLDLGWLLCRWPDPGQPPGPTTISMTWDGMPSRVEMAQRYSARTGFSVGDLHYYMILALFKLTCLLEGGYYKALRGTSDQSEHERFGDLVLGLLARAKDFVDRAGCAA